MFLSTDLQQAGLSRLHRRIKVVEPNPYAVPISSDIAIGERFVEFCKRDAFVWPISDISTRLERINILPLPRFSSLPP